MVLQILWFDKRFSHLLSRFQVFGAGGSDSLSPSCQVVQVNCLRNPVHNCWSAVRAVVHINMDDEHGLEERAERGLSVMLHSLSEGNTVGVTPRLS